MKNFKILVKTKINYNHLRKGHRWYPESVRCPCWQVKPIHQEKSMKLNRPRLTKHEVKATSTKTSPYGGVMSVEYLGVKQKNKIQWYNDTMTPTNCRCHVAKCSFLAGSFDYVKQVINVPSFVSTLITWCLYSCLPQQIGLRLSCEVTAIIRIPKEGTIEKRTLTIILETYVVKTNAELLYETITNEFLSLWQSGTLVKIKKFKTIG